jgi:ElaB/YqjD/DUF883 family membrane-anchored ribosome-binding protein
MSVPAESIHLDPANMDMNSPEFAALMELRDLGEDGESDTTEQDENGAITSGAVDNTTEKEAPIVNPSNTGTIPYGVLKGTREELANTKRMLDDATARLRELEAVSARTGTVEVPKPGQEIEAEIESAQAQADELEALAASMEEDFPEFGKAVRTMTKRFETQIGALTQRLEKATSFVEEAQRERTKSAEEVAREAVDNNPYLSAWMAGDQEAWNIAYEHDLRLRSDPKWQGKPIAERFAKAVQYTLIDKPDALKPTRSRSPKEADLDLDARVSEALQAAGAGAPNSISHIPTGEAPVTNEMGSASAVQLEAAMERMTPDQIGMFLSKFA